jgi:4'-phosphopantetheinyl transferase
VIPRISVAAKERFRHVNSDTSQAHPAQPMALPAPDPSIALWLCRLECSGDQTNVFAQSLSPSERQRADRFGTPALRSRWIAGRAALRRLLGEVLAIDPAAVVLHRGIRGRPQLAAEYALDFNVSHTDDVALICIGTGLPADERIGVDIEREDRDVNADGLARKFMTDRERAAMAPLDDAARHLRFLKLWTCKEAMSKATGAALSAPFRNIDVAIDDTPRLVAGPAPYLPDRWRLLSAAVPAGLVATVAIWRGI